MIMATIPSFERLLLEVHQSLELERYQGTFKKDFSDLGLETKNHQKKLEEMLDAIFRALDMDPAACHDALGNLIEWSVFHKALELHTWTSNADQRQIVWHLLGYSYVPGLARRIAFWNLEGAFDKGMPGGEFWFLPHLDALTRELQLPVPSVVKWLLDLLGLPMDQAKNGLGGKRQDEDQDSIERSLYNWLDGKIPRTASIEDYFPNGADLEFKGTFQLPLVLSEEARFEAAIAFLHRKQLDAEKLRDQIPKTQPGRLEAIIDGSTSDDEKQDFVELLLVRYAKPSMRLIRQRLLAARMVQDGYRRLLKFLCPDVSETCTDPAKNKILQLFGIFGRVYNLSVGAWKDSNTRTQEDALFESRMLLWEQEEILLSILPSRQVSAYQELAAKLTRRFTKIQPDSPLEDWAPVDDKSINQFFSRKKERLQDEYEADDRRQKLVERIHLGSPWRALQAENDYWVVSQVAPILKLSPKVRNMAIARMRELASTPSQVLGAICIELGSLLNCPAKERPKDVEQLVAHLLDVAKKNPGFEQWKAPLLQYDAKHHLARNEFKVAETLFAQALNACSERNFGPARGEIARDAFATAVADQRLISGNHEKYFRNMRDHCIFEAGLPSLEDAAVAVSEYFWEDLYKPYPKVENKKPLAASQAKLYVNETIPLIFEGNWEGLECWLRDRAKAFRKQRLSEVRGDTVLLSWLKMRNTFAVRLPFMKASIPTHLDSELRKIKLHLENWRTAMVLLVKAWPEQVNLPDFKGQTPLMLAADADDEVLLKAFLAAGADINVQDYGGRTPLHAAVTGRSGRCVAALLELRPDTKKVAHGDQTALHTAVRMAHLESIRHLLSYEPTLATRKNMQGQSPMELAQAILSDLQRFQEFMASERRHVPSREEIEAVIENLKATPTLH